MPVAAGGTAITYLNTPVEVRLRAGDADGNALRHLIVRHPANGVLRGSGSRFLYTPNRSFHGTDSFSFQASDGSAKSKVAEVVITVRPSGG